MTDSLSDRVTDALTPAEAAVRLGVSERTIWRRIKAGKLDTEHTLDGVRVLLSDAVSVDDRQASVASDNVSDRATDSPQPELMKALEMVSELTRRNEQLAGQLGFTQAKLQEAERTVALLMVPTDEPAPEPPAEPERRPWWKRWIG
jgi:excisionase family DNA binding protein